MPVYEYRCDKGHSVEVLQRMSDAPVETCTVCGAAVQRVFTPVAVHFKGSGFYNTDYGKQKRGGSNNSSSEDSGGASKSDGADSSSKESGGGGGEKKAETSASGSAPASSD